MKENWFVCENFAINMNRVIILTIIDNMVNVIYDGSYKETFEVEDGYIVAAELEKWLTNSKN